MLDCNNEEWVAEFYGATDLHHGMMLARNNGEEFRATLSAGNVFDLRWFERDEREPSRWRPTNNGFAVEVARIPRVIEALRWAYDEVQTRRELARPKPQAKAT